MLKRIIAISLILFCADAGASGYNMDDLRALKQQGGWEELLAHAKTIRPSERNAEWQALVTEAANNYLATRKSGSYAGYTFSDLVAEYPFLQNSAALNNTASNTVVKDMEACLNNIDSRWGFESCVGQYKDEAKNGGVSPDTAIQVARLLKERMDTLTKLDLPIYYEIAVKPAGNENCNAPDLQEITLNGLTAPSYGEVATSSRNIAFQLCKNQMAQAVQAARVKESANYTQRTRHFMQNYCVFNAADAECVKGDF